jgi:hypothetical protein
VVCTAPSANAAALAAYVCKPGEQAAHCPDAASLKNVAGLDQLLQNTAVAKAFASMPWACLATGAHQFQCARDVGTTHDGTGGGDGNGSGTGTSDGTANGGTGDGTPAGGNGSGGSGAGGSGGTADGSGGKPPAPSSCVPTAWEPYFAQLATYEYKKTGIQITFPRGIFDTSANFTDLSTAAGSVKTTPGAPSCHDGEWDMRQQSWLDAVQNGCDDLRNAILVLCQQAANYAPNAGACNATGTW